MEEIADTHDYTIQIKHNILKTGKRSENSETDQINNYKSYVKMKSKHNIEIIRDEP